jgi:hypothetical protein
LNRWIESLMRRLFFEQQRKSNEARNELRLALQGLAMTLVDYRVGVR